MIRTSDIKGLFDKRLRRAERPQAGNPSPLLSCTQRNRSLVSSDFQAPFDLSRSVGEVIWREMGILEPIGKFPPAETQAACYRQQEGSTMVA